MAAEESATGSTYGSSLRLSFNSHRSSQPRLVSQPRVLPAGKERPPPGLSLQEHTGDAIYDGHVVRKDVTVILVAEISEKEVRLSYQTKVSTKGQVVLPGPHRRKLDIRAGDPLDVNLA